MRILQICLKPPYPKEDGGCLAIAAITESLLLAKHNVKVLCMATHKHPFIEEKVPTQVLRNTKMEAVKIDTRIKPLDAFFNLFTSQSYHIQRFDNHLFRTRLIEILQESTFDIIHLESIFCAPYLPVIRQFSKAKIVLRAHNIEFEIWEQLASQETNVLKSKYLQLLASRLKTFEISVFRKVDAIIPITQQDADTITQLGVSTEVLVVPIGIRLEAIAIQPLHTNALKMYHVGAMDWQPNKEGIAWFINEIWPKISTELPTVRCWLAGRNMPDFLLQKSEERLIISGEISSVSAFIADKNIAVVPLLSGSGMRVKIVEALAFGKVVITTSLGATGIPYKNGENILIANTPQEFVQQLKTLQGNPSRIGAISQNARALAESTFNLRELSSKLTYFYDHISS